MGALAHITNWPASQATVGSASNATSAQAATTQNVPTSAYLYGWNGASWDQLRNDGLRVLYVDPIGAGGVSFAQGTGAAASNSTNAYIGGSIGFGAPGSPSTSVSSVQGVASGTPMGVSLTDGSDATLGAKSDTAAGSGSASVVALLKQIHLDSSGAIPAGSNNIGTFNVGSQTVFNVPVVSAVTESSHVLKSTPGQLYSLYVTTSTSGYLMLFNSSTVPADGAVSPVECVNVPANAATSISFSGLPPENYTTGITAVFSSTGCFVKTASATAFFHGAVQ